MSSRSLIRECDGISDKKSQILSKDDRPSACHTGSTAAIALKNPAGRRADVARLGLRRRRPHFQLRLYGASTDLGLAAKHDRMTRLG